jgi:hypothetical protein
MSHERPKLTRVSSYLYPPKHPARMIRAPRPSLLTYSHFPPASQREALAIYIRLSVRPSPPSLRVPLSLPPTHPPSFPPFLPPPRSSSTSWIPYRPSVWPHHLTLIDDRPVQEHANDGTFHCLSSLSRVPCHCWCSWRWTAILGNRAVHHVAPYAVFPVFGVGRNEWGMRYKIQSQELKQLFEALEKQRRR